MASTLGSSSPLDFILSYLNFQRYPYNLLQKRWHPGTRDEYREQLESETTTLLVNSDDETRVAVRDLNCLLDTHPAALQGMVLEGKECHSDDDLKNWIWNAEPTSAAALILPSTFPKRDPACRFMYESLPRPRIQACIS